MNDLEATPNDPGFIGETPEENLVLEATPEVYDIVLNSYENSVDRNFSK